VLSVKPQVLDEVLPEVRGGARTCSLVVSIVAGAPIRLIADGLANASVVRVMPNTPARIGQGISVWTATAEVPEPQREQARRLLRAFGEEIFVKDEDYLDMATALSGTGPAYIFLFMEAMVDAGGTPRLLAAHRGKAGAPDHARLGGVRAQSGDHLAELRNQVTSPGGTSAEALYQLEKGGLRTVISRAIWAAYQRSVGLGGGRKVSRLGGVTRSRTAASPRGVEKRLAISGWLKSGQRSAISESGGARCGRSARLGLGALGAARHLQAAGLLPDRPKVSLLSDFLKFSGDCTIFYNVARRGRRGFTRAPIPHGWALISPTRRRPPDCRSSERMTQFHRQTARWRRGEFN